MNNKSIIDKHFNLTNTIDSYYKKRDENPINIEKCIDACKEDIKLLPRFIEAWIAEDRSRYEYFVNSPFTSEEEKVKYRERLKQSIPFDLRIPSLSRLAIIYEKQGKIQEAIDICKTAISLHIENDGTTEGFSGTIPRADGFSRRQKRLENKLK